MNIVKLGGLFRLGGPSLVALGIAAWQFEQGSDAVGMALVTVAVVLYVLMEVRKDHTECQRLRQEDHVECDRKLSALGARLDARIDQTLRVLGHTPQTGGSTSMVGREPPEEHVRSPFL